MHPTLDKVFDLVPSRCPSVLIAGGAAADIERAEDVDVWFIKNRTEGAQKMLQQLEGKSVSTSKYASGSMLVGNVFSEELMLNIQILASEAESPEKLLEGFDLSPHMIAINSRGELWTVPEYTTQQQPIRVYTLSDDLTRKRYLKLCKRYGQAPDPELLKLLGEIIRYCDNSLGEYPQEGIRKLLKKYYAGEPGNLKELSVSDPF